MSVPTALTDNPVWAQLAEWLAFQVTPTLSVGQIVAVAGILSVAVLLRTLLAKLLLVGLHALAKRTHGTWDEGLIKALERPAKLFPFIVGLSMSARVLELEGSALVTVDRVVLTLTTAMVFWALYRAAYTLRYVFKPFRGALTPAMVDWLIKLARFLAAFIGVAAILEIWGVPVGPIIAGLGIFGVAVALGAQDLFKNLIAGLSILLEKRFEPGDWILVNGLVEGTVERINFRSTTVRRFDKSPVYVPNAKLSDNAVTNFSRMTHRRIFWKIGVEYGTSSEQLRTVTDAIKDYVTRNEAFAPASEVSTFVFVDSFNASSIDIMLYCFTRTTNWGEWLKIKEDLAIAIKEIVEAAGCAFAFPSQTNYLVEVTSGAPAVADQAAASPASPALASPSPAPSDTT